MPYAAMEAGRAAEPSSGPPAARRPEPVAYAAATLCWLLGAGVYIAVKWASADMPPWTLAFWRPFLSALILLPLVTRQAPAMWQLARTRPVSLLIVGGLGLAISQGFIYTGLHHTSAVNAGLIIALSPILTGILAHFVLKEPFGPWQAAGSVIAFAGMAVIIAKGQLEVLLNFAVNAGDLWMVGAAVCFTGYSILLRRAQFDLARLPLLVLLLAFGAAAAVPLYAGELLNHEYAHLNLSGMLALAYVAIPGGAVMYYLYNYSVDVLGAGRAGVFLYLQIFFVAILAWLLLGEHLEPYHYVGAGLIIAGVTMVTAIGRTASGTATRPKP